MRHRNLYLLVLIMAAASPLSAQQRVNPFFSRSTLPFQAPPFDRIQNSDYEPAIEEGMKRQLAEIERIANQKAPPTFANTIVAMENTGELLNRVQAAFSAVTGANTNDTLQAVQTAVSPKLAAHRDAIYLNMALFRRVKSIYDRRASLKLSAEQLRLVDRYYTAFVRSGALLSPADQARLRAMNEEESRLSNDFSKKLLAGTRAGALVVDDAKDLAGLSPAEIAAAAAAAKSRKLDGKYVIPLQNTTQQPAQASLENREIRQRLFEASIMRNEHGDANDTREIVKRIAELRAQRAKLLGYPTFAAYRLADQGAGSPENAIKLLTDLAPAAVAKAKGEAADMQKLIGNQFTLAPWDWQFYSEKVRKAQFDLDESELKPYFLLDRVLKDGVFFAANQMYGLTFKERHDIPVYHPDVRVFEVFDQDGQHLALFYADYFKRDNKRGGAWMSSFVGQSKLKGTQPVVYNVANFNRPAPGQPALLTSDEMRTMFHEFGHALHGMFSNITYPFLAGTPRDFVEFPSQFNEHWATEPRVFANFAKHYQTNAPMPAALVEKMRRAGTFGQGFATTEYVAASLLDLAWHTQPAGSTPSDVDAFEADALRRFNIAMPEVPPRYRTTYFNHIWASGYASAYYAYMWSEILDDDAYAWFVENGGMTRKNGQRFRDMVLSRGSTVDAAALYRAFRGRDPDVKYLIEQRGLNR